MSKTATKEKNNAGLSQDEIRRAAKRRRKNTPKKSTTPGFSIREAKKEQRERERQRREEERELRLAINDKKRRGILINQCIDAVFAGADRTGLCVLYSVENNGKEQRDENGDIVPPRFAMDVRAKAQQEIFDWCKANTGKYECRWGSAKGELLLANIMFVKKG